MRLRQHQQEFLTVCNMVKAGNLRRILCLVTPGGGKSNLPVIAAQNLIGECIDKIAWFTPRISLCTQAEESFLEYGGGLHLRRSDHEFDPTRGLAGFSATYQSLYQGRGFLEDFERHRYAIFLDECHHIEAEGTTHKALMPLLDRARLVVYLSGNINRHDEKPVAGLRYQVDDKGRLVFAEKSGGDTEVIKYQRKAAIRERAVLPAYFSFQDGRAEWVDTKKNVPRSEPSIAALTGDDARSALTVVLKTGYAIAMIDRGVADWSLYRKEHPRSKMIVLAPDINSAKIYTEYLKKKGLRADYAVSYEDDEPGASKRAQATIRRFKYTDGDRLDILVAVGMAHEGLDVKSASHLVVLTRIRSHPWLEQAIARVTRYDPLGGPFDFQKPVVYIPDDEMAHAAVAHIEREQVEALRQRDENGGGGGGGGETGTVPISSDLTRERSGTFDATLDYDETERLRRLGEKLGISAPAIVLKNFVDLYHTTPLPPSPSPSPVVITPRDEEDRLRKAIQKMCGNLDYKHGKEIGTTNKEVYARFGSRLKMSTSKLKEVMEWLKSSHTNTVM